MPEESGEMPKENQSSSEGASFENQPKKRFVKPEINFPQTDPELAHSGGSQEIVSPFGGMDMRPRRVELPDSEHNWNVFDREFLQEHTLPEKFTVVVPGETGLYEARELSVVNLLTRAFVEGGAPAEFGDPRFRQAVFQVALHKTGGDRIRADDLTTSAIDELNYGILALCSIRSSNDGTFSTLSGDPKSSDPKSSALADAKFHLPLALNSLKGNEKRALAMFLAMDDEDLPLNNIHETRIVVGKMNEDDKKFAESYKADMVRILNLNTDFTETKRDAAGQIEKDPKTGELIIAGDQEAVSRRMDEVADKMAEYLQCKPGKIKLALELATVLGMRQKILEYRKLYRNYSDSLLIDPEETATSHILKRAKVGEKGYLAKKLETEGVDGLIEASKKLKGVTAMRAPRSWWAGMRNLKDNMDSLANLRKGLGEAVTAENRAQKRDLIVKIVGQMRSPEVPQISATTAEYLIKQPMESGKGEIAEARQESFIGTLKNFFSDVRADLGLGARRKKRDQPRQIIVAAPTLDDMARLEELEDELLEVRMDDDISDDQSV
jgi:hypothetical protein